MNICGQAVISLARSEKYPRISNPLQKLVREIDALVRTQSRSGSYAPIHVWSALSPISRRWLRHKVRSSLACPASPPSAFSGPVFPSILSGVHPSLACLYSAKRGVHDTSMQLGTFRHARTPLCFRPPSWGNEGWKGKNRTRPRRRDELGPRILPIVSLSMGRAPDSTRPRLQEIGIAGNDSPSS